MVFTRGLVLVLRGQDLELHEGRRRVVSGQEDEDASRETFARTVEMV